MHHSAFFKIVDLPEVWRSATTPYVFGQNKLLLLLFRMKMMRTEEMQMKMKM